MKKGRARRPARHCGRGGETPRTRGLADAPSSCLAVDPGVRALDLVQQVRTSPARAQYVPKLFTFSISAVRFPMAALVPLSKLLGQATTLELLSVHSTLPFACTSIWCMKALPWLFTA